MVEVFSLYATVWMAGQDATKAHGSWLIQNISHMSCILMVGDSISIDVCVVFTSNADIERSNM